MAHTYKLLELVGSSTQSSDDAIRSAIAKAALTVKHMEWFHVVDTRGHIVEGKIAHYQVTLKVGFRIEEDSPTQSAVQGKSETKTLN